MRHIFSILLQNEAGALLRVAGLFSSRGYNIDSLTVAPTDDESVSRLTVVTEGSDAVVTQIYKQLSKLVDVVDLANLTGGSHHERELIFVKFASADVVRDVLEECAERYGAQILEDDDDHVILQLVGTGLEVADFMQETSRFKGCVEVVRGGVSAIASGAQILSGQA